MERSSMIFFQVSANEYIAIEGAGTDVCRLESTIEKGRGKYAAAIDGLESLILACASRGVEITSTAFCDAVTDAIEAIANHYGD
jgi:hypothetical protein